MQKSLLSISLFLSSAIYAQDARLTQEIENKNTSSQNKAQWSEEFKIAQQSLRDKNNLSEVNSISPKYSDQEIANNQQLLEDIFVQAVMMNNKFVLPKLIELYEKKETRDQSLIEWANAILLTDSDLSASIKEYRKLIANFPDNDVIRYQLAVTLFNNQEYEAAKAQFEKLNSSERVSEKDREVFANYIDAINKKDKWNFYLSGTYLNDDNLGNTAKPGTKHYFPNGSSVTSGERQKGNGLSIRLNAGKQWSLSAGKYLDLNLGTNVKYYWNNKKFNEIAPSIGLAYGYRTARYNFEVGTDFSKRFYGGGSSGSSKLHSYYDSYGINLMASAWLTPNLRNTTFYSLSYDKYYAKNQARNYDGSTHSLTNSIMFVYNPQQYWTLSLDASHKSAKISANSYNRYSTRLTWGQEWPYGISSSLNMGVAYRKYLAPDWFGFKQKNNEYNASLSLWHRAIHYQGLTPRLTLAYNKTNSNMKVYSYDKFQLFLEFSKSF